jgi:hypothetical protein
VRKRNSEYGALREEDLADDSLDGEHYQQKFDREILDQGRTAAAEELPGLRIL